MRQAIPVATVSDHPRVAAVEAELATLYEQQSMLDREFTECHSIGGWTNQFTDAPLAHASEEQIIRARQRLAQIPDERRSLKLQIIPLEKHRDEAIEQARREIQALLDERRRAVVARLDAALTAAARVNDELAALDADGERLCGTLALRWAWHELLAATPTFDSRIAAWRRSAREHGLLL